MKSVDWFFKPLFAHYFVKIFNHSPAMLENFASYCTKKIFKNSTHKLHNSLNKTSVIPSVPFSLLIPIAIGTKIQRRREIILCRAAKVVNNSTISCLFGC